MAVSKKISQLFILLFLVGVITQVSAQEKTEVITAKNSIFAEVGGNGFLYSINYGRIFSQKGAFKFSGSAGLSHYWWLNNNHISPVIPIEITVLWGKSQHHLELGSGTTLLIVENISLDTETNTLHENNALNSLLFFRLGYRYQKPEGGFFFRIGYTPGFDLNLGVSTPSVFFPFWGGISLGKSF